MADLDAAHDSLLYGTTAKHHTTAFDICYYYRLGFKNWLKIENVLFHKISKMNFNKFILFLISMISVNCRVRRLAENSSIFLYLLIILIIVSLLLLQVKNYTESLEILNSSNWTFVKIS